MAHSAAKRTQRADIHTKRYKCIHQLVPQLRNVYVASHLYMCVCTGIFAIDSLRTYFVTCLKVRLHLICIVIATRNITRALTATYRKL
jgi:hypothetical protein